MARRAKKKRRVRYSYRLTLAGWLFLAIALLLGTAAVRSQVALMFVVFGGMLGAVYISAVMARRVVHRVEVQRVVGRRVWQYRTVPLGYQLRNPRRHGSAVSVLIREAHTEGLQSVNGFCAHLPAGGVFRAGGRFWAQRRGRLVLRQIEVSTTFPFGLVRAVKRIDATRHLMVWPARGRLKASLLRHGAVESSSSAPSQATGGQDEFFGLREYRPGDNARWIHWRRSTGRATPVVREMTRPLPEILWLIVDTQTRFEVESWPSRGSGADPDSGLANRAAAGASSAAAGAPQEETDAALERRLRFAATLADHAFAREYQVGLALARGQEVCTYPPAAGRGQRHAVLDALARAGGNHSVSLARVAGSLRRAQVAHAQVMVLAAESARLADVPLRPLASVGRHLLALCDADLPRVFDDTPPPEPPENA